MRSSSNLSSASDIWNRQRPQSASANLSVRQEDVAMMSVREKAHSELNRLLRDEEKSQRSAVLLSEASFADLATPRLL